MSSETAIIPETVPKDEAALSLLSLSVAATSAAPTTIPHSISGTDNRFDASVGSASLGTTAPISTPTNATSGKHHRRLSSTGRSRRRLSDARDAANRPSPAILPSSASGALSMSSLSLSSSPPPPRSSQNGGHTVAVPITLTRSNAASVVTSTDNAVGDVKSSASNSKTKKRGMDHKCESCSKIYRHPSCLIKHRWEHTPHWREASKFVLSKHQQVQMLEAAAILSHMSTESATGTSLPEDRSLWPSFLSGGSLTHPAIDVPVAPQSTTFTRPSSSSVPASSALDGMTRSRSTSTGPRLHDYALSGSGSGGITQLRPGLLGVSTGLSPTATAPMPMANSRSTQSTKSTYTHAPSSYRSSVSASPAVSKSAGGWSLPSSSLRSSSRSRSRSDEDDSVIVDIEHDDYVGGHHPSFRTKKEDDDMSIGFSVREEDEEDEDDDDDDSMLDKEKGNGAEWDGMAMEMDMD